MKIIVSPAKTQQNEQVLNVPFTDLRFYKNSEALLLKIQSYSKDELATVMSIKGKLLEQTVETFASYNQNEPTHGIRLYTGLVFKGLEPLEYTTEEQVYLRNHVRILSAFYGVVEPFDAVKPYRLDMKMKVLEEGLYKFWQEPINQYFGDEEIINLASSEFSKLIKTPMTTVTFKEEKEAGIYKVVGTYAKQARGNMLLWMIRNNIQTIESIKGFDQYGYQFNTELSTKNNLVFTRSQKFSL